MVCRPGSFAVSIVLSHMKRGCGPHTLEFKLTQCTLYSESCQDPTDVTLWLLPSLHSLDKLPLWLGCVQPSWSRGYGLGHTWGQLLLDLWRALSRKTWARISECGPHTFDSKVSPSYVHVWPRPLESNGMILTPDVRVLEECQTIIVHRNFQIIIDESS